MKKYVFVLFVLCIGLLLACSDPESVANIIQERVPAAQSISIKEDMKTRVFYVGDTFNLYKDFYDITPTSATITPGVSIRGDEGTVSFNKSTGEFKCLKVGKVHITLTVDTGVLSTLSVSTSIDVKEKESTPSQQEPQPTTPEEEFVGRAKLFYDEKEIVADSDGKYLLTLVNTDFDKVEGLVLSALLKVETAVKGTEDYQNDPSYEVLFSTEEVVSFEYSTQKITPDKSGECCLTVKSDDEKWEDISFDIVVEECKVENIKNNSEDFPSSITLYTGINTYSFAPVSYPEYAVCAEVVTEYDSEYLTITNGILYPKKLTEKTTIKLSAGDYIEEIDVTIADGIESINIKSFCVADDGVQFEITDFSNLTLFTGSIVNLTIEVATKEEGKNVSFRVESNLKLEEVYSSPLTFTLGKSGTETLKIIPDCDSSKSLELNITVIDFVPLEDVKFIDKENKIINVVYDELVFDMFVVDVSPANYTASHYEIDFRVADADGGDASEYIAFADGKVNLSDSIPVGIYTIYVESSNGKQDSFTVTVIDKKFLNDYSFIYLTVDNDGGINYVELADESNLFTTALVSDINTVEIISSSDNIVVDSAGGISFVGVGECEITVSIESSYNNFSEYTFTFIVVNPITSDDINLEIFDAKGATPEEIYWGEEHLYILKVTFDDYKIFDLDNLSITGSFVVVEGASTTDNSVTITIYFEEEGSYDITVSYTNITQTGTVSITESVNVATPVVPEPEISTDISGILSVVNGGEYTMTSDIWLPDGFTTIDEFKGTLNGNGFTIFNLRTMFTTSLSGSINNVTFCAGYIREGGEFIEEEAPLLVDWDDSKNSSILCLTNKGTISGVSVYVNIDIATSIQRFGVVACTNEGNILNSHVYGCINILGASWVGGFVYQQMNGDHAIDGCSATLRIIVNTTGKPRIGGFINLMTSGQVQNCEANITFTGTGSNAALGGFTYNCTGEVIKDSVVRLYLENTNITNEKCKIFMYHPEDEFGGSIINCSYLDIPGFVAHGCSDTTGINLKKLPA